MVAAASFETSEGANATRTAHPLVPAQRGPSAIPACAGMSECGHAFFAHDSIVKQP